MSEERIQEYQREVVAVAIRQRPHENPPRIDGLAYPYANINLTDEQLRRLPMYARVAIAYADATINKLQRAS